MHSGLKATAFRLIRAAGVTGLVQRSAWRRSRVLILCYHGISLEEEHLWRPELYVTPELFRRRLQIISESGFRVEDLHTAWEAAAAGRLEEPTVVITFDDGFYDFFAHAGPALKDFGMPATVYQTTYYVDYQRPIFNLIVSYMLFRKRSERVEIGEEFGVSPAITLGGAGADDRAAKAMIQAAADKGLDAREKDALAAQLAAHLGIDYEAVCEKRILGLMTRDEIRELSAQGIDFQLHTHRHRTPKDEELFRREIRDNRVFIEELTGKPTRHFCYPSGVWEAEFEPWLEAEKVLTGTTCAAGIVRGDSEALHLPRMLDWQGVSDEDFRSWLSGLHALLKGNAA